MDFIDFELENMVLSLPNQELGTATTSDEELNISFNIGSFLESNLNASSSSTYLEDLSFMDVPDEPIPTVSLNESDYYESSSEDEEWSISSPLNYSASSASSTDEFGLVNTLLSLITENSM